MGLEGNTLEGGPGLESVVGCHLSHWYTWKCSGEVYLLLLPRKQKACTRYLAETCNITITTDTQDQI